MSGLNSVLWLRASLPHGQPDRAVGPIFATVIFIAATLVALVASKTYIAQFILLGALAAPVFETIRAARRRD
jgi:flagellin-like protein